MTEKGLLSITEMARLRGITTETLRHYDRIGLLKPDALDENNVRYYSVLQYEKLETIRELQEIGLSLKEIGAYLEDRNVKTSYALLCRQQHCYAEKLREYAAIKEALDHRIAFLSSLPEEGGKGALPEGPFLQTIGKRRCLRASSPVRDEISLAYGCMELKRQAREEGVFIPTYASDNYVGRFPLSGPDREAETELLLVLARAPSHQSLPLTVLPGGTFLCLCHPGSFWDRTAIRERLLAASRDLGLSLSGEVLLLSKIDCSITDAASERLIEVQAGIAPSGSEKKEPQDAAEQAPPEQGIHPADPPDKCSPAPAPAQKRRIREIIAKAPRHRQGKEQDRELFRTEGSKRRGKVLPRGDRCA